MYNKRKQELAELKFDMGLMRRVDCTAEENAEYFKLYNTEKDLPDGIYKYKDICEFYIAQESLSYDERMEYVALKQYRLIRTIKNCVVFFTVLAVIGLIFLLLGIL